MIETTKRKVLTTNELLLWHPARFLASTNLDDVVATSALSVVHVQDYMSLMGQRLSARDKIRNIEHMIQEL
jgi:hypothetical protein